MKTKVITSALSLVLVLAFSSLFAARISDPGSAVLLKAVTYVVKVTPAPNFGTNGHYLVAITDGNGSKVAPAQPYHQGVSTYTFKESAGTFKGTRVAILIPFPAVPNGWNIMPDKKSGIFYGGATYQFNLAPDNRERETTSGN